MEVFEIQNLAAIKKIPHNCNNLEQKKAQLSVIIKRNFVETKEEIVSALFKLNLKREVFRLKKVVRKDKKQQLTATVAILQCVSHV